jgi:hypothetical protein
MTERYNPLGIWTTFQRPAGTAESRPRHERDLTGASAQRGRGMAGRVSIDRQDDLFVSAYNTLAPFHPGFDFVDFNINPKALRNMPPSKLMELLADVSPDVSRALWDFLLFCNPGWTARAYKPGTKTEDKAAQKALDDFLSNLHGTYSVPNVTPADVVLDTLFMGAFLRGGFFAELVLDADGRMPLEIATPDPATVRFRRVRDEERGPVWQIGQQQIGGFVPLDRPTVCYVPIHPLPGKPEGRPLAAPALFTTLFLIGLFHDLRRVVSQQGYPRLDIEIDYDLLKDAMPEEAKDDPVEFEKWLDALVASVEEHYGKLEPDDAFIHGKAVKVNRPVGAVDSRSLGAVEGIIKALERQAIRALKTMPLLFGVNEATTETHANRQWEIHVAGIKSLQHLCETMLERLLTFALLVQSIQADIEFRFSELRAAERIRDAQAEALEIANAARKRDEGWQKQDESAQQIVGHKAVAPPPAVSLGGAGDVGDTPPGSERRRSQRASIDDHQRIADTLVENALQPPQSAPVQPPSQL